MPQSEEQWILLGYCKFCRCKIYGRDEERRYEGPDECNCELQMDDCKCLKCGWHGIAEEAENIREDDYTEYLCPDCNSELEEQYDDT